MREPPRLLVVDDNILEARLARQGYEVISARDGDLRPSLSRPTGPC
jgi:hypothetical protein